MQSGFRHPKSLQAESLENRLMLSTVPPTVTGINVSSSQWDSAFIAHLENSNLGTAGYSIPVGSSQQLESLPWTTLNEVRITFSEDVNIKRQDLSITGVSAGSYETSDFFYDPATMTAVWTLTSDLAVGDRVHLDLDGSSSTAVQDLDGNILDGEWTDEVSTYASGDGTAGGDFEFSFNVLKGDTLANELVDYYDYYYTRYAEGYEIGDAAYNIRYDIDGDGTIEQADWEEVLDNLWATLPSGTPPGAVNDAPTTTGFDLLPVTDRQNDQTINLHQIFDDAETPDNSLTYTIVSQSDASHFDSVSINPSTGVLSINATDNQSISGRSEIVVQATDAAGLSVQATLTVDLDYTNQAPVISNYHAVHYGFGTWTVTGQVTDADDDVVGMIVELSGVVDGRAVVQEDGYFYFTFILQSNDWGYEYAEVTDPHGATSNTVGTFVGLT